MATGNVRAVARVGKRGFMDEKPTEGFETNPELCVPP